MRDQAVGCLGWDPGTGIGSVEFQAFFVLGVVLRDFSSVRASVRLSSLLWDFVLLALFDRLWMKMILQLFD